MKNIYKKLRKCITKLPAILFRNTFLCAAMSSCRPRKQTGGRISEVSEMLQCTRDLEPDTYTPYTESG